MSPSEKGSWPGSAPSRNRRASAGVAEPRRTSTDAVTSSSSSAVASARTSPCEQGVEFPGAGRHRAVEGTATVGRIPRNAWKNCFNSRPRAEDVRRFRRSPPGSRAPPPPRRRRRAPSRGRLVAGVARRRPQRRARAGARSRRRLRGRSASPTSGKNIWIAPESLGAGLSVSAAVSSALAATPRASIALPVRYSRARLDSTVAALAKRFDRRRRRRDGRRRERIRAGVLAGEGRARRRREDDARRAGRAPPRRHARAADAAHPPVAPTRTEANFGPVDRRHARRQHAAPLRRPEPRAHLPGRDRPGDLPDARRPLADHGQAAEPVVVPADDERLGEGPEAGAARPVEPARHALDGARRRRRRYPRHDAPTSIGYSVSHGCIRMQVPDAEWLFEHVHVGTPVVIL